MVAEQPEQIEQILCGILRIQQKRKKERILKTLKAIERWKRKAAKEIDNIGTWRDTNIGDKNNQMVWRKTPNRFYDDTAIIEVEKLTRYPKLDFKPIGEVYEAIYAWYANHNAVDIPPQSRLKLTLALAMGVINGFEVQLLKKMGEENEKDIIPPNPEFTFDSGHACYEGHSLNLPSGEAVDILRKLYDSLGQVVKHKDLNEQSTNSNASDTLKANIGLIKKTLKRKTPYCIEVKRGYGYLMERKY